MTPYPGWNRLEIGKNRMNASLIALLVLFSGLLASGQITFKMVARSSKSLATFEGLLSLPLNLWFWLALCLYASATLLWIFILQKIDLIQAYPFVSLGFVIVPTAAYFILGEKVNAYYFFGIILILCGLWLTTVKIGNP